MYAVLINLDFFNVSNISQDGGPPQAPPHPPDRCLNVIFIILPNAVVNHLKAIVYPL